jgi:DNA-binding protein YbaB
MTGWQEQIADNARRYGALSERLARTSATETSRDGVVRVTVSADGSLTELVLAEPRQPLPMHDLAAQIMGCVQRARARIPDLIAQAMADTVGHDESTDLVLADARTRFPPAPAEPAMRDVVEEMRIGAAPREEPVAPRLRRRAGRDDRNDGWDERPILEDV